LSTPAAAAGRAAQYDRADGPWGHLHHPYALVSTDPVSFLLLPGIDRLFGSAGFRRVLHCCLKVFKPMITSSSSDGNTPRTWAAGRGEGEEDPGSALGGAGGGGDAFLGCVPRCRPACLWSPSALPCSPCSALFCFAMAPARVGHDFAIGCRVRRRHCDGGPGPRSVTLPAGRGVGGHAVVGANRHSVWPAGRAVRGSRRPVTGDADGPRRSAVLLFGSGGERCAGNPRPNRHVVALLAAGCHHGGVGRFPVRLEWS